MVPQTLYRLGYIAVVGLLLSACARQAPTPTPNLVETEVAVQKAAIATLTAEAPVEPPSETPVPATSTPMSIPTSAPSPISDTLPTDTPAAASPPPTPAAQEPPTNSPTPVPLCTVSANALNLRTGPGTVYEPPLVALPTGMELIPLAFNPSGFPSGQWLQVQVLANGQTGWVSVGPQFIACNLDLTGLPLGVAPPTPTPVPTLTPTSTPPPPTIPPPPELVTLPPDGGKGASGLEGQIVIPVNVDITSDKVAVFHDKLAFRVEVYDPSAGSRDGAGIREVRITIRDNDNNDRVHERTERTAGYCVFGGGEPDCNVWILAEHDYKWPDGQTMVTGKYNVTFDITRQDGSDAEWIWSFLLQR